MEASRGFLRTTQAGAAAGTARCPRFTSKRCAAGRDGTLGERCAGGSGAEHQKERPTVPFCRPCFSLPVQLQSGKRGARGIQLSAFSPDF